MPSQVKRNQTEKKFHLSGIDITAVLFAVLLLIAPLFPDVKLTRPKLLSLELGIYTLLFLYLIINFYLKKIEFKKSLVFYPIITYGLITAVFYYISPDRHVALSEFKRALLSISSYFVAANVIKKDKQRNIIFITLLTGGFLAILYGIAQHFGGFLMVQVPKLDRVMSFFGNPIFFAAHIVIILPIAIGLIFQSKSSRIKALLSAFILASILALYYTKTRAAYIGFGVSLLIFSFLTIKSKKVKIYGLLAFMVFFGVFAYATKNIWFRQQAHSLIWRDSMVMWSKTPILGTGPGTFHIYFTKFASPELKKIWPQSKFIVNDAHSEYVQYLTETGIIGFGIFLWLLISIFVNASYIYRKNDKNRFIISGLIASASGILVQNAFSVDMRFIISAVYFFFIVGFLDSFSDSDFKKEFVSNNIKLAGIIFVVLLAGYSYPQVLRPYIAQKVVSSTPDFFDEKVLNAAETISELEKLRDKYPDNPGIYEKLAWIYSKDKNWPKAIPNFEKAHELNPKLFGPLNNLGNINYLQGNRKEAITYWRKALEIEPTQVDSRLNLATAYYYEGQLKDATDELKIVLQIDKNNQKAIVMLKSMVE